jgi:hypothetical protein
VAPEAPAGLRAVRRASAALLLALLAGACATRPVAIAVPEPAGEAGGPRPGADLRIECDRARIVVPDGRRGEVAASPAGPPWSVGVAGVVVVTREAPPEVEVAGEDLTVVAEGGVRTVRREGAAVVEEGPYRTVVLRNGRVLRR